MTATNRPSEIDSGLEPTTFRQAFTHFRHLAAASGENFTNFHEGLAADWEDYKPRLRERALSILASEGWSEDEIGSGTILGRVIGAIEIHDSRAKLTNNLVSWRNRYGPAGREHRVLLEAVSDARLRQELERLLFGLYRGGADEGVLFEHLSKLTNAKYPLLAYLYFLKDMDRFMPILPTTFDHAFRDLGIDLVTRRRCSWANYRRFNEALEQVRKALESMGGFANVRLIDAHSFCWMLEKLKELSNQESKARQKEPSPAPSDREISIMEMMESVQSTVKNSNGQMIERIRNNKELRMTLEELNELILSLLNNQSDRCALTGIPFQFGYSNIDRNLKPSVDRIDSNGHYESGNIQIVCRFINFWKSDMDNSEFKGLLMMVREAG